MKTSHSFLCRIGFAFAVTLGAWTTGLHAQPGALDSTFNATVTTGQVGFSVAVQPDGKVIAVGTFGVVRLLGDGSVDPTFQAIPPGPAPFVGPGTGIGAVTLQPDGRILITGNFTNAAGTPLPGVVRLNADGSIDASFNADPASPGGRVLALQPDGKILVGSAFGIVRLRPDGSLDESFDSSIDNGAGEISSIGEVYSIVPIPNGRIYYSSSYGVGRLNSDGSRDDSFNPGLGLGPWGALAVQPNGKVLVGQYGDGPGFRSMRRLLVNGTDDPNWTPPQMNGGDHIVFAILLQPDGKVLVGGNNLESFNGVGNANLGRLHSDGSVDTTFDTRGDLHYYSVEDMALAPEGKVIVAGHQLNRPDITAAPGIWRLNNDAGPRGIEFTASTYVAREGDRWVKIPVRRTGSANRVAIVHYSVRPGTATRGRDYFGWDGALLFRRDERVKHIRLYVVRDGISEGSETVRLSLKHAHGDKLGPQSRATLTILDR